MLEKKGYELMAKERGILAGAVAENIGRRLGWQGEDVAMFAETLKAIAEVTAKDIQRCVTSRWLYENEKRHNRSCRACRRCSGGLVRGGIGEWGTGNWEW